MLMTESHSHHAYRAGMSLRAVRKGCFMGFMSVLCWKGVLCAPVIQAYAETVTLSPQCFLLSRLGKTCTEIYGEIGKRKEQEKVKEAS